MATPRTRPWLPDDVDGFLDAPAFGDHVFNHEDASPAVILNPRRSTSLPSSFSAKMNRCAQLAGDFLTEHEPAHGRRDDSGGFSERNLSAKAAPNFSTIGIC